METFMQNYFETVFGDLGRDCLNDRLKRREMVQYFSTAITGCAREFYAFFGGENKSYEVTCRNFVRATLRYHNDCKRRNNDVCLMGKYHNLLYVTMKLVFDWSLQDSGTVAALLDELYACESTFERLFLGAIFGTSAPHFLAGWKSDFLDKEENIHALVFYLDHATNSNSEYFDGRRNHRFIDVPLESCGNAPPVRVVIQMGAAEVLMILLRFGARIALDSSSSNPIESLLERLNEYNRKYPYELVTCLKLVLRAVPSIFFLKDERFSVGCNHQRKIMLEKYGDILEDHLIPSSRCGLKPVELKHLCRCKIRDTLWNNFQLPFGIQGLPLPEKMKKVFRFIG
ncbi:hypothetical protein EVAR_32452_1 [Eumeta japonica]|uniref:SOCS box domain-containing protein n=1 Tax=Eumeta variegata TaxID=151549 RepID=A0A4C1VK87_EUMVA|nr:hypothetical protein EVAR_32452_1 [Eumeta japonica]